MLRQQAPDQFRREVAPAFLPGGGGGVVERPADLPAGQQALLVEAVQRRHHRRVGDAVAEFLVHVAHVGFAAPPERLHHPVLERTEVRPHQAAQRPEATEKQLAGMHCFRVSGLAARRVKRGAARSVLGDGDAGVRQQVRDQRVVAVVEVVLDDPHAGRGEHLRAVDAGESATHRPWTPPRSRPAGRRRRWRSARRARWPARDRPARGTGAACPGRKPL